VGAMGKQLAGGGSPCVKIGWDGDGTHNSEFAGSG
jgi:hypothetical protein